MPQGRVAISSSPAGTPGHPAQNDSHSRQVLSECGRSPLRLRPAATWAPTRIHRSGGSADLPDYPPLSPGSIGLFSLWGGTYLSVIIELPTTGEPMELTDQILMAMKDEGKAMTAGQVSEKLGAERKDVDKAFKVLKKEERIVSPKNCYWEPK